MGSDYCNACAMPRPCHCWAEEQNKTLREQLVSSEAELAAAKAELSKREAWDSEHSMDVLVPNERHDQLLAAEAERDALREAAIAALDARDGEAKATLAAHIAIDNFNDAGPALKKLATATVAASEADQRLRAAIDRERQK